LGGTKTIGPFALKGRGSIAHSASWAIDPWPERATGLIASYLVLIVATELVRLSNVDVQDVAMGYP